MPQRPSKKAKPQTANKSGAAPDSADGTKASQQRHRDHNTKAILGKFRGRKSV